MGYLIISRVGRDGKRKYVAWMPDDGKVAYTLFSEMQHWLTTGDTCEILDYIKQDPPIYLNQLQVWRDHFREQGEVCG